MPDFNDCCKNPRLPERTVFWSMSSVLFTLWYAISLSSGGLYQLEGVDARCHANLTSSHMV